MTTSLAYSIHGPEHAPWLTLSHPIGASRQIWDPLLPTLARDYRVLTIDTRGHGATPAQGAHTTLDTLADDVLQLWQALDISSSHFLGLSLGGCIGMTLALQAPQRLRSLVVACARLDMDAAAREMWQQRAALVEAQGMAPVIAPTLERWFTPAFLASEPTVVQTVRAQLAACSPQGFAASARALAGLQLQEKLAGLRVPTLFLAGQDDKAVPTSLIETYARLSPGAELQTLAGPHILPLENPDGFSRSVLAFLQAH